LNKFLTISVRSNQRISSPEDRPDVHQADQNCVGARNQKAPSQKWPLTRLNQAYQKNEGRPNREGMLHMLPEFRKR